MYQTTVPNWHYPPCSASCSLLSANWFCYQHHTVYSISVSILTWGSSPHLSTHHTALNCYIKYYHNSFPWISPYITTQKTLHNTSQHEYTLNSTQIVITLSDIPYTQNIKDFTTHHTLWVFIKFLDKLQCTTNNTTAYFTTDHCPNVKKTQRTGC